jgi:outer membrane receptor protein involved in Fe transport
VVGPQGIALPGATVKLLGTNRILVAEVSADEQGRFALPRLAAGRYELRVESPGFSPVQRVLEVPRDAGTELTIEMRVTPVEYQVTVTGRHGAPEETFVEPASVRLRSADELRQHNPAHLPRMLEEEPGVLTQETTPGQGSPVLRGQGAQTVLYLLDGVRFNNSIYRSGNVQYLGWIPAAAVDSVELFLGPAGTQHGSDALGGAINVMTAVLPAWRDQGVDWGGELRTQFSTADIGAGSDLRAYVAGARVSLSLIGSYRRHQELRPGGGEDSHSSLSRFLGLSAGQVRSVLGNRLRDSDYAQSSWAAKLGLRLGASRFLTLHWLESEQYGVRRYDRLLGGEGHLRSELQPQRLGFGYARFQRIGTGALRSLEATFSVNRQTDGQISQTREDSPLQQEVNRVTALGYVLSTSWAPVLRHTLTAGAEFYDEFIFGRRSDTPPGGTPVEARPRFPNGTRYGSLGLYLADDWELVPEKVLVESGIRFSYFRFHSRASKNVFVGGAPTVPDATETFGDVTFNAGLSYALAPPLVLFGRVARGSRAPSVFDLGELGLTGGGFEISPREAVALGAQIGDSAGSRAASTGRAWRALEPEVLWSFEGGVRWRSPRLNGSLTYFDSEFFDALQRRSLLVASAVVGQQVGGQTIIAQDAEGRIFVDLSPRPVVSRANIGRVRIQGLEGLLRMDWNAQWSSAVKASLQRGRELDTRHFARRIAPDTLFLSLRWSPPRARAWVEGFTEIAGPQTRRNPGELDDPRIGALRDAAGIAGFFEFAARRLGLVSGPAGAGQLILTGETLAEVQQRVLGPGLEPAPLHRRTKGYATLNLRGSWVINDRNELFWAALNLTDTNYRRHGSGFDAPGVGLSLSYRVRFRP